MAKSSSRRITNICVFCGSSSGNSPKFVEAAQELGRVMAQRKIHQVYGDGSLGLMGVISKAVQDGLGNHSKNSGERKPHQKNKWRRKNYFEYVRKTY